MAAVKVSGIYEIVNLVNGKRYVGSAVSIPSRWSRHRHDLRNGKHRNRFLQNAWDKHGHAAFSFRVLENCNVGDLIAREQVHIDLGCDYNLCKVAGSLLGTKRSPETCARLSAIQIGKKCSPESIAKSAEGHRGKKRPRDAVERTAAANRGRKHSDAHREKLRVAGLDRLCTLETRAKLAAASSGKKHPPDVRRKMSEKAKLAWAKRKAASA